jgi:hypothetical protein
VSNACAEHNKEHVRKDGAKKNNPLNLQENETRISIWIFAPVVWRREVVHNFGREQEHIHVDNHTQERD